MSTFFVSVVALGVFALIVGLIVAVMEWWDARHAVRKHKPA